MKRVLILGAGFGGIAAAHHLRSLVDHSELEILLIDRSDHFAMGFHKVSWIVGREQPGYGSRPLAALASQDITVKQAAIDSIDPAARSVVAGGKTIEADAIIVALGADVASVAVDGLNEHGFSIYDHDGATAAAAAFSDLQSGRVVIAIFGAPYKCPPAPFELALLAHDAATAAGKKLSFTVVSPLPMSLPALGQAGCNPLDTKIAMLGIDFLPNTKCERVEEGRVILADGAAPLPFDLLLGVAPHRPPQVIVDAGLAQPGGWIPTNPRTLATKFPGVYALGDCTVIPLSNGQAIPKAGAIAEEEGIVAASRIAAELQGAAPDTEFQGIGSCFLEVGGGEAMLVQGTFLTDPPNVTLTTPSKEQLDLKHTWEQERLQAWFG